MTGWRAAIIICGLLVVVAQVLWAFVFVQGVISVVGCDNRVTGDACVYSQMGLVVWLAIEAAFGVCCYVAWLIIRWRIETTAARDDAH